MQAIYIIWTETQHKFKEWKYCGNGVTEPTFTEETITKRARYTSEATPEMMARAQAYIDEHMTDRPTAQAVTVEE